MDITSASTELTDRLTDMWVDLASDQRTHGSHLLGPENRTVVRETVVQRIVADNILVAHHEGSVVGFVMFTVEHGRYEQDVTPGLVENLYVAPDYRGEGVGTALLEAAEDDLRGRGVDAITLEAMADNDAGREFYRANGYRPHRLEVEKSVTDDA